MRAQLPAEPRFTRETRRPALPLRCRTVVTVPKRARRSSGWRTSPRPPGQCRGCANRHRTTAGCPSARVRWAWPRARARARARSKPSAPSRRHRSARRAARIALHAAQRGAGGAASSLRADRGVEEIVSAPLAGVGWRRRLCARLALMRGSAHTVAIRSSSPRAARACQQSRTCSCWSRSEGLRAGWPAPDCCAVPRSPPFSPTSRIGRSSAGSPRSPADGGRALPADGP
jgi:hypothetical protein